MIYPDREHDDVRFDCTMEAYDFPNSDDDAVPVELPVGAALMFNGYLLLPAHHRNTGCAGLWSTNT